MHLVYVEEFFFREKMKRAYLRNLWAKAYKLIRLVLKTSEAEDRMCNSVVGMQSFENSVRLHHSQKDISSPLCTHGSKKF